MKKILALFLSFLSFGLLAQDNTELATRRIKELKDGILLVRLRSGEKQAQALEKAGSKEEAQTYRKNQAAKNQLIIAAFRKNFTFCPVFFFYAESSDLIRKGNIKSALLNDQLQPDSLQNPPAGKYLAAEIGTTDRQHIEGLIMLDDQLNQMEPPFPWLVRLYSGAFKTRTESEMVSELNKELWKFYKK